MSFSAKERREIIRSASQVVYDLVIIGGGITGAGIALDAVSRGLKTLLVEKGDFASGTSSKSTKLIHGGLRYLKQFEFKLVHESGTERAIVHGLAPHLVRPEKMLLPLVKEGSLGKFSTSVGLRVYDFLADVKKPDRRKMLSAEETLTKEPLLDKGRIIGGGYYAEYRTDDARLTLEIIKKAHELGAEMLSYCRMHGFLYQNGVVAGVKCKDSIDDILLKIKARKVVSAAGPWVDEIRKINDSIGDKRLHLTKGVHLVVPYERFPVRQSIYFDTPDGRMVFAIPRGRIVYIGTTDTSYCASKERILVTKMDRDYLLEATNLMFPAVNLTPSDVVSNWAGLRPLIHQEGKAPSELSRKDEIFESPDGLLSIAGGKLTGYRKMAEKVVNRLIESGAFGKRNQDTTTDEIQLCGECIGSDADVKRYIKEVTGRVVKLGLDKYHATYLVTNYGRQLEEILSNYEELRDADPEVALALAECKYGCLNEMVIRAEDFFIRRTGRLFFDLRSIPLIRPRVMDFLQETLSWSSDRRNEEEALLDRHLADATHYFDDEEALSR